MKFLYPLGLLGLIGIPILILVYIIKNRYTEQTVSSTYLWTLSERFLKRRNPLSKITGIISLILQLLLVAALSLAVAHPIVVLPGEADEYCFILDGSGSMNISNDGKTRFELAKEEVVKIIDKAENGSVFSLVFVSDMTETVFELEDNRELIKERIAALECSDVTADYTDSIGIAQGYFNENPSLVTYLITDTDYAENENIIPVNVAGKENNISLEDVKYTDIGGGNITVSGNVVSYGADRVTDIEIYSSTSEEVLNTQQLQLEKDKKTEFSVTVSAKRFYSITVKLTAEDALAKDNTATVYNIESENAYKALLVSDTPFLLESAVKSVSIAELTVMTTEEYKAEVKDLALQDKEMSGYGLYIYDAFTPENVPTDGSVWFVGPSENVENSGFSIQGVVELDEGAELTLNKSSNTVMKKLTSGVNGEDIFVKKYMKCGVYGNFSTIFSYMGNPLVFTGATSNGNRQVVFAFNLHDSNFTLSSDYLILLHNLLDYSFPAVIEETEYYCGETAEINVISGCTSIRVEQPSGEVFYSDTASAISEFVLTEVGEYKITAEIAGTEREFYIYSSLPMEERCTSEPSAGSVSIRGEAGNEGRDGVYDTMLILFIVAAVLFTAEWMVYCYDKYQFR